MRSFRLENTAARWRRAPNEGNEEIVRLLIESGAEVNYGSVAANEGNKEIVRLLVESGATLDAPQRNSEDIVKGLVRDNNSKE